MSNWNRQAFRNLANPSPGLEFTTDRPEYDNGSLAVGEAMTIGEAEAMANMDADVLRDDHAICPAISDKPGPHASGESRGMIPDSEVPRGTLEDERDAEA